MKTKRIIVEQDVRKFFASSINSMEDAMGIAIVDIQSQNTVFDFNAVLLLRFDGVLADTSYSITEPRFDPKFILLLQNIISNEITEKTEYEYLRNTSNQDYNFLVKVEKKDSNTIKLFLICIEKLLETELQLSMFSNVVGAGISMFAGSTWWINYDRYRDHFYQSDKGPEVLGIPISPNQLYNTREFQKVRDNAREVSEFYDESIQTEADFFERLRNNETDFFGGRTPALTANEEIVWVEAYGKCLIRYPDGSPRFVVAIDIYMSEIFERTNQLEILNNLMDYGLISSEVGVWYHQRHFTEGRYYFTESYQALMAGDKKYKNESITDLLNEQIQIMIEKNNGHEHYLHTFREVHNSIYIKGVNKYHLVIPNIRNNNDLQWIDVRGTVIERDQEGHVLLFVGVNVDVTESFNRSQELERLRIQNERLQLAETLAVKARNLLVWYQAPGEISNKSYIFGNNIFVEKLGVNRTDDGLILFKDIKRSIVKDDPESTEMARRLIRELKKVFRHRGDSFKRILAKHRHLITGEILYLEHSIEVTDSFGGSENRLVGGIMLDVTENILYQQQIHYLANHDVLTGTNNRNYFESFIKEQLPDTYSILLFDLDGLKLTNDAFGHTLGDTIIIKLADMLKTIFKDNLFVARIGGDEFVVLTEDVDDDSVTEKARLLEAEIEKYNQNNPIELNVSKGGMRVINNDLPFDKAFVQAENIMYRRKLNSRSSRKSKVLDSILETLNAKTEETKEHSERMSVYAIKTIQGLGLTRSSEVEDIELLAKVHDIGKITIPDDILHKPGKLTQIEFELIKRHCEAGYKIIRNITDSDEVCNGVLFHHERWDGNGYPQGLKGEEIPIFARVISVVDTYDAMTNDRIYQQKRSQDEAVKELIRCSGTQFDPKIVQAFLKSCLDITYDIK